MGTFSNHSARFKKTVVSALVVIAAFSAGRYSSPESVKEVEKIVYRETTDETKNSSQTTKEKKTIKPDGTVIIENTVKSENKSNTKKNVSVDQIKELTTSSRPDWRLNVLYTPYLVFQDEVYTLDIQRRVIGEVYLGVNASTQKIVGVSISIGF